ncbi:MAG: DUF6049 family protein, partial [Sciscionella sp.]
PKAAVKAITPVVISTLAAQQAPLADFEHAMRPDQTAQITPRSLIAPLQQAQIAATASAYRGAANPAALSAAMAAQHMITSYTDQITVSSASQRISLASKDSPLPISISNTLPVSMRVSVELTGAAGLQPKGSLTQLVPARSSRTVYLPTKVLRSGQFVVDARLVTAAGTPLGHAARLELVSSAYGAATIAITGTAFAALILLSGRRIYRRVRAARADSGPSVAEQAQEQQKL